MQDTFISLLSDALHEKTGSRLPDQSKLNLLLAEAVRHGVAGALIQALPEEARPIVQSLEATLHAIDMVQVYEGPVLLRRMTEQSIPCIPLKGWVIRDAYPLPHLRNMGDLDLLIPSEWLPEAEQVMLELGYVREQEHFTDYHVCYSKPPCLTVELHIRLTAEEHCPVLDTVWERAVVQEDGHFHLSNEDCYLFLIYHAAKHVILGGIGLRYIMDLWVLLNHFARHSIPIQREQVTEGLNQLGLTSFAAYSEQLAADWFGAPAMSLAAATGDAEAMHLWRECVLSSGAFGGAVSSYQNQLAGLSALPLAIAKIFPARKQMEIRYPVLRQKHWLLPKFWIVRLWEKLWGGEALIGVHALSSISPTEREQRRYLLAHLGLL